MLVSPESNFLHLILPVTLLLVKGWMTPTPSQGPPIPQGGVGLMGYDHDHGRGGGGVFLLEVQYSILKSLISTCVLSYIGSREDWLLDRICRDRKRRASYPYQ